jgi:hypothetical protein
MLLTQAAMVEAFAQGGGASIARLEAWPMRSMWGAVG